MMACFPNTHARHLPHALPVDETSRPSRRHHLLENMTQDVALPKTAQPIDRERRVVRNLVIEIELAEPAVSEVEFDLLTKPALRTNAVAVTHQKHSHHQFGINRRPADVAVES